MARIRYLKPDFFEDEHLAQLPFVHRLTYAGLWCLADKAGRLEDSPVKIKARLFSSDLSTINKKIDIDKILEDLTHKPFIVRYEAENKKYIEIINFLKHQRPHHTEKNSEIPPFNGEITVKEPLKTGGNGNGKGNGKGNGECARFAPPTIEEVSQYCLERNKGVDPNKWFNHYQANGWMVGRNKMKDWKAAVRTWEREDYKTQARKKRPASLVVMEMQCAKIGREDIKQQLLKDGYAEHEIDRALERG